MSLRWNLCYALYQRSENVRAVVGDESMFQFKSSLQADLELPIGEPSQTKCPCEDVIKRDSYQQSKHAHGRRFSFLNHGEQHGHALASNGDLPTE